MEPTPTAFPAAVPEQVHQAAQASNRFGIALYQRLHRRPGNIVLSPVSASTALAMTWAGARGETSQQMGDVLHLSELGDQAHSAVRSLTADLRRRGSEATISTELPIVW